MSAALAYHEDFYYTRSWDHEEEEGVGAAVLIRLRPGDEQVQVLAWKHCTTILPTYDSSDVVGLCTHQRKLSAVMLGGAIVSNRFL